MTPVSSSCAWGRSVEGTSTGAGMAVWALVPDDAPHSPVPPVETCWGGFSRVTLVSPEWCPYLLAQDHSTVCSRSGWVGTAASFPSKVNHLPGRELRAALQLPSTKRVLYSKSVLSKPVSPVLL